MSFLEVKENTALYKDCMVAQTRDLEGPLYRVGGGL